MKREILKKALLLLPLLGIMGGAYFPEPAEAAEPWPPRDNFYWLGQMAGVLPLPFRRCWMTAIKRERNVLRLSLRLNHFLLKLVDRILPRFMPDVPVRTC